VISVFQAKSIPNRQCKPNHTLTCDETNCTEELQVLTIHLVSVNMFKDILDLIHRKFKICHV